MAGTSIFTNLGRGAKVLALLFFLLPWVTVSCSPQALERLQTGSGQPAPQLGMREAGLGAGAPIAEASGLDMALGTIRPTVPDMQAAPRAGAPPGSSQAPEVPVQIGVVAAAALLLLALLGSFLLKGAAGAIAGIGGSALALAGICYSVFISYPPAIRAAFAAQNPSAGSEAMPTPEQLRQLDQILSVKTNAGFWLVVLMLALAILFNALALRKSRTPAGP